MFIASSDIIEPHQRVIIPGRSTTFTCRYRANITDPVLRIIWLINGTQLDQEDLNQRDGIESDDLHDVGHLYFNNISVEYNDTTIRCLIFFTSSNLITSNIAILLVQGEEKY